MTVPDRLIIEPLDRRHDRSGFSCGIPELDQYLMHQAGQDVRRRFARAFVCTSDGANAVLGFYTLSTLSIDLDSLPAELVRKLPRHPVPCVLLGRLAVDAATQGRGIGSMLIADAIKRTNAVGKTVGVYAMIVDATNEAAKPFYMAFGFLPFQNDPMRLFLPLSPAGLQ